MNATAAVLDFAPPIRHEWDPLAPASDLALQTQDWTHHADELKRALKRVGLTMIDISARTKSRFGEKTPYFIPQTFLYKQKHGITPHICQVAALSEVTNYRFSDWMKLCGFDFRLVPALQLKIPNTRTTVLTPSYDRSLSELLSVKRGSAERRDRYLYAKIGSRDAVVYPEIKPGSIVRADQSYAPQLLNNPSGGDRLWLVEHPNGLTCCRIKLVSTDEVVLLPNRPPLNPWPLRLSDQARILGLVDRELHCTELNEFNAIRTATTREMFGPPATLNKIGFSSLLRLSRRRTGITFREAHKMTLQIAHLLRNRNFGIAASLLSDYEAMNKIPRHIAKIISLCVIYGIDPVDLLQAGGVRTDDSARLPISLVQESGLACT